MRIQIYKRVWLSDVFIKHLIILIENQRLIIWIHSDKYGHYIHAIDVQSIQNAGSYIKLITSSPEVLFIPLNRLVSDKITIYTKSPSLYLDLRCSIRRLAKS